jgi:hypothetical protein
MRTRKTLIEKRVLGPGSGGDLPPYICKGDKPPSPPGTGKELENMSTSELKQHLDCIALVLQERQRPSKNDRDLCSFADAVHEKTAELLAGSVAGNAGPLAVRQIFQTPAVWGPILAFLERSGYLALKPAEKTVVYRFLAELVVRHAYTVSRKSRAPLSPKLVASCSGNLGGLFERSFPGYLRNGLASVVAGKLCSPT